MPRIPEGKFRRDPSVRVEQEASPRIDAGPVARQRALGKQFVQVSETLRNAKRTAHALDSADRVDEEFNSNVMPELEQFAKDSVNGKVKDPVTGDDKDYSVAVEETIEKANSRALASFGTDTEAMSYYSKYTRPKMEQMLSKAKIYENKQIVDHRNTTLTKGTQLLAERYIDGDLDEFDVKAHADKILSSKDVIGKQDSDRHLQALYKNLAYQAPNRVKHMGYTKEGSAENKKFFSYLNETERREVEREYDKAEKQVRISQAQEKKKTTNAFIDDADTLGRYILARPQAAKVKEELLSTPIDVEYENPRDVTDMIGKVVGKELSVASILNKPNASLPELQAFADEYYDKHVKRTVAGEAVTQLGEDRVKEAIVDAALQDFSKFTSQRDVAPAGAFAIYQDLDPRILDDIASGNPTRRAASMNNLSNFYDSINLPISQRVIVGKDTAESQGKAWQELEKGSADRDGKLQLARFNDIQRQYGEHTLKAVDDMIKLSGGTKSGTPAVPNVLSLAARLPQEGEGAAFVQEMFAHRNQYNANIELFKGEEGLFSYFTDGSGISGKAKFEKKVNDYMSGSNLSNLMFGRYGENDTMYKGTVDMMRHRTAWYMTEGGAEDFETAIANSERDLKKYMGVGKSDNSSIVVDHKFLKKHNMDEAALNRMTKNIRQLDYLGEYFKKTNSGIAWDAMMLNSGSNKFMADNIEVFKRAKTMSYSRMQQEIKEQIGANIMAVTDSTNPNAVKLYIKPRNGEPFPLLQKIRSKKVVEGIPSKTSEGRPVIKNKDGTFSTERTATVRIDGKFYNVPTMFKGKQVSESEASRIIKENNFKDPETGRQLLSFSDVNEASTFAEERSKQLANELKPTSRVEDVEGTAHMIIDLEEYYPIWHYGDTGEARSMEARRTLGSKAQGITNLRRMAK